MTGKISEKSATDNFQINSLELDQEETNVGVDSELYCDAYRELADLIGAWLFPTGAFFPGFTVSAVLTGLIFGWVLYNKEVTFVRALLASALVCLIVNLLINTYWLTIIIGKGFNVLLASRAVKEIVAIPVMATVIVLVDRYVLKHVKNRSIN